MVIAQGFLLGVAFLLHNSQHLNLGTWTIGISSILLKGAILPWLLTFVLHRSKAKLEVEPFIGFGASLFIGILLLGFSSYIAWNLSIASTARSIPPALFSVALFLILSGMFLIITRKKAITQTIGYLVLENGVFATGLGIGHEFPFIVEMGVMLDIFVGVFLMGIMIFRIDKAFDHTDTHLFNELLDKIDDSHDDVVDMENA
ncbi:MAG: hypothetical protein JXX29_17830 [Deltaproteobacteria bacterium]|nr:hypothetical protein [Deltaproteobacteria bacterium]MBN2673546.1 hypothetical protein [Deltaproteobacteria bacterium]